MKRTNAPEHYIQMLSRFKDGVDTISDPQNAFVSGTPKWMIDEWVEFNTETVFIC